MPKNRKICEIFGLTLFFSIVNMSAAGMWEVNEQQNKTFEVKQPLSEWPEISLLPQEELYYKLTWDKNKKLEENQQELLKIFMSSCCDFSFRIKERGPGGIYSGKFDDGENIIFIDKETRMFIDHSSNHVIFFDESDGNKGLDAHPETALLSNVKPIDFQEWMKCELERYIQRFVEDPVGCEILRISIAKHEAGQRGLPKIKFIPQDDAKIDLAFTSGSYVWKRAKRVNLNFNVFSGFCKENRFIIFSPEWFNTDQQGLMLKLCKTKSGADRFRVNQGIIPREAGLMYQIIYAMHVGQGIDYDGTQVIEKRDDQNYFCGDLDGVGPFSILRKRLNVSIFKNDKIYRTMYGLTKRGFDLINESSYLAHKYAFIRPAYTGYRAEINVNGKTLNKKESCKFLKKFFKTNGDFDLYMHYLSSKSSIQYPEFGKGQYRCSDVDFEKRRRNY